MKIVKNFSKRNVNLLVLSERIESFFKKRGFETQKVQYSKGHYVIVAKKLLQEGLNVRIAGDPNDFSVELSTEESSDTLIRLGTLTSLFGGGILFLKGMKSKELLDKVESDFWRFVEEACKI